MPYNSAYTGAQVDQAVGDVLQNSETWDGKQDKLTGTQGQVVGFDSDGDAVAMPAPDTAVTFSVTLSADSWSSNSQTISNSQFIADGYVYVVSPDPDNYTEYAAAIIRALDVTSAGNMTFECSEAPTIDVDVHIVRIEVS